jgi:hypothetical protein
LKVEGWRGGLGEKADAKKIIFNERQEATILRAFLPWYLKCE